MSNLDIPNVLPDIFLMDDPITGSKSILRKNLMEIPAATKTTYNPENQQLIKFNISSPGDFMIGTESFLKFDLQVTQTANGNPYVTGLDDTNKMVRFGPGGAHNLFKNIQIRTLGGGVLLQEVDHYNIFQGIENQLNISRQYTQNYGPMYGDFSAVTPHRGDHAGFWVTRNVTGSATGVQTALVGGQAGAVKWSFSAPNTTAGLQNYAIGCDYCIDPSGNVWTCTADVGALPANAQVIAVNQSGSLDNVDLITDGDVQAYSFYFSDGGTNKALGSSNAASLRSMDIGAGGIGPPTSVSYAMQVSMQPYLTMLQHNFPLFLFKEGVELIFELDSFNHAFISNVNNITYTIDNPKYMVMMIAPHPDIQDKFETMWRSDKGLLYRIPSVKVRRQQVAHDVNADLQFPCGVRSAMKAVLLQTDSLLENLILYDRTRSLRMNTNKYHFKVGSINFPNREVTVGLNGSESYRQLLMAFDRYGQSEVQLDYNKYARKSIGQVFSVGNAADGADNIHTADRFYIGVDFRRVTGFGDNLSGIDLSNVPLDVQITRNFGGNQNNNIVENGRGAGQCVYYLFVYYDAYLKISSQQISVLS